MVFSAIIPALFIALVVLLVAGVRIESKLKELFDGMVRAHKQSQIDRAKNSLVKALGWIVVPLPVFVYFQRRLAGDEAANTLP